MKRKSTLASILMLVVLLFGLMPAPQAVAALTTCDWAQFVSDVNYPDGTVVVAGAGFDKTWRIKNIGSCTWTGYTLVYVDGTSMGAPASTSIPGSIASGSTVDLTVHLTAPASAGTYRANFQLKNASSVQFGIGSTANKSFWVEIKVGSSGGSSDGIAYNFVGYANDPATVWSSSVSSSLTFPTADPNANGVAKKLVAPITLESGATNPAEGLLVAPDSATTGYIQGIFTPFTVQSGDHFQSIVNCELNATSCYVNFRLKYQIGTGPIQTFWSFNEKYEGLYYSTNLDLSSLAGQSVKFILWVGASGSATGDRAVWGGPRITRSGAVTPTPVASATAGPSPTPSMTPTAGPSLTPSPTPAVSLVDRVTFISDVNYPDGSVVAPGATFVKTWSIKNPVGYSTWTTAYKLTFVSGDMSAADVPFVSTVTSNTTISVSVTLTAPSAIGHYRGYWMLKNASGVKFGLGSAGDKPWWVDIYVNSSATAVPTATSTGSTVVFDFSEKANLATWANIAGPLTFPGADLDPLGFVIRPTSTKMENGITYTSPSQPTLLTAPQSITDGFIQGIYPAFNVVSGDHFKTTVGCEFGAASCKVFFRLDYVKSTEPAVVGTIWTLEKAIDGFVIPIDVDLVSLAGSSVTFRLTILADGASTGDRAVWLYPRIVR